MPQAEEEQAYLGFAWEAEKAVRSSPEHASRKWTLLLSQVLQAVVAVGVE